MSLKPITFKNQGQQIQGMWHEPETDSQSFPAVLFLHGFLATKSEAHRIFIKMSRQLAEQGIASLRIDFRGCGESEGNSKDVTITGLESDAQAAIAFLKKQPNVDVSKIAVLGMSLGGGIASTLADFDPSALVLWAPVANLLECTEIKIGEQNLEEVLKAPFIDYFGEFVGQEFLYQIAGFEPTSHLKAFQKPVKVIQGTDDLTVPVHQSELYEAAFKKNHPLNHRFLIEGADHQFSSIPSQEQLFSETLKFLKEVWA